MLMCFLAPQDNFNNPISGLVAGDYRMDGKMELMACASEGEGKQTIELENEHDSEILW